MARRASNITIDLERLIIGCIKSVRDKISWDTVINEIFNQVGERYTEQALRKHQTIADAYRVQRALLTNGRVALKSKQKQAADVDRLVNLEFENKRLVEENERYRCMFVIWAHNAYSKNGLTEDDLNEPIVVSASE